MHAEKNIGPAPPKRSKKGRKNATLATKREDEAHEQARTRKSKVKYDPFDGKKNAKTTLYRNPWTNEKSPRAELEQGSVARAVANNMEGPLALMDEDTLETGNNAFKALY